MKRLCIGIDFDNTIVCYDDVFHKAAMEKKLIPPEVPHYKGAVRDFLRSNGKENLWTELQGYIYGARMDLASQYPGFDEFLSLCHANQIPTFIISHKTLHPFLGPRYNLHEAAKIWLQRQSFPWTPPAFFELTLQDKLKRISQQDCTVFIDDLPEVLSEKAFPQDIRKILFDPNKIHPRNNDYDSVGSWNEVLTILKISENAAR